MAVDLLQHINVRAADLERSKDFYVNVLGLAVGVRPPIVEPGYWLYLGHQPVVHLSPRLANSTAGSGGGAVDHIAFHGVDFEVMRERLGALGLAFREALIPRD